MENRFNLVDEPWIPVADVGLVSLRDLFSHDEYRALGGNPVQKIALLKLLLAIAQAAATPENETQWREWGHQGMAERVLAYLDKWHDRFYLYGDKPFLQMPIVEQQIKKRTENKLSEKNAKGKQLEGAKRDEVIASGQPKSIGAAYYPDVWATNNTILSHTMMPKPVDDAESALFVLQLMNFSFGGKRVEADLISLDGKILGNKYSASSGPSLGGYVGYLHTVPQMATLQASIWLNVFSNEKLRQYKHWGSVGIPPWELAPETESCKIALALKESYMATLLAMSRFVYLKDGGIYYCDGIKYPSFADGWSEPSLMANRAGKKEQVKYVNTDTRPWRELTALLGFVNISSASGFENIFILNAEERLRNLNERFYIWSGGLRVSQKAGDQSVKQTDDFVESLYWLYPEQIGAIWFNHFQTEMTELDKLSKTLYGCVMGYFKAQLMDGKEIAGQASNIYWQLCERDAQALINDCDKPEECYQLRKRFADYAMQTFNQFCPNFTARQLDAWAKTKPNFGAYLKREKV